MDVSFFFFFTLISVAKVFATYILKHEGYDMIKKWKAGLKDNWQEIFPQIPVTVSVEINIKTSTLNQEPNKAY